jgi:hypothetical protein
MMLRRRLKGSRVGFTVAFLVTAGVAGAQEYVTTKGKVSDDDFYRIVACAAPPGGDCQRPFVRWSQLDAKDVSVRIVQIDAGYPAKLQQKFDANLDKTLSDLNAVGAELRVSRAPDGMTPDVRIFLLDIPKNGTVAGTGLPWFDGQNIGVARAQMGWRGDGTLIECAIGISTGAKQSEVQRILIEEITQCMGLFTDIGGANYESRSIFSETSGQVSRLGAQDIMALRRHYP